VATVGQCYSGMHRRIVASCDVSCSRHVLRIQAAGFSCVPRDCHVTVTWLSQCGMAAT
jgi:hypothetical protein